MYKGKLFVISGPSGVGKTTICKALCQKIPDLKWSVSTTTRPRRRGEINGKDYYFVSEEQFSAQIEQDAFIEYAKVHDYYYGTSKENVEKTLVSGQHILVEIDVQGAYKIKQKQTYSPILFFIAPPDMESLKRRLLHRNSDSEAIIQKRLENAIAELEKADFYDKKIINISLEQSIVDIYDIMQNAIGEKDDTNTHGRND